MSDGLLRVYNASAGSGKTYTLVREYLVLVLRHAEKDANYFKRVLGITFTNKAAAEMKGRVLEELARMAEVEEHSSMGKECMEILGLERGDLAKRAEMVRTQMLHHYGDVAIRTIDSFVHQVVRSFARDLDLDPEFEVTTDVAAHIARCLDELMETIGRNTELTRLLERYAGHLSDEEKRWDLRAELLDYLNRHMASEVFLFHGKAYQDWSATDWKQLRALLQKQTGSFEKARVESAQRGLQLLESVQLEKHDFLRGIIPGQLARMAAEDGPDLKLLYGKTVIKALEDDDSWTKKSASADVLSRMEQIRGPFREALRAAFAPDTAEFKDYMLARLITSTWYEFRFFATYLGAWQQYLESQNLLPVSDFQERIGRVVEESPAPFIYERIGERFSHFMLDEFQDTSVRQWQNLLPLVANGLDRGYPSLIVGDGKQSIYRWRGAFVQQFVDLSSDRELVGHNDAERTVYRERNPEPIKQNWRSGRHIVRFNNALYRSLRSRLGVHEAVYRDVGQEAMVDLDGAVHIRQILGPTVEDRSEIRNEHVIQGIRACENKGYQWRDMAILVRGRKDARHISEALRNEGIRFTTHESLLLKFSPQVRKLIHALELLHEPDNQRAAVQFLSIEAGGREAPAHWMQRFRKKDVEDSGRRLLDGEAILHEVLGIDHLSDLRGLTCLEQLERLCQPAEGEVDPLTEALFEAARSLAESGKNSFEDFNGWWEASKEKFSAATSPTSNAVQILTVHKSKGLQFPVVFVPMTWSATKNNTVWVDNPYSPHKLPARYRNSNSDPVMLFPEETEWYALDDMNVLYVATTRARERLYLSVEIQKEDGESLNHAVLESVRNMGFRESENGWVDGEFADASKEQTSNRDEHLDWRIEPWEEKLKVAYEHIRFRKDDPRAEGNRLHHLLAEVSSVSQLEEVVHEHMNKVWSESGDEAELLEELRLICTQAEASRWFAPDLDVKREVTLLADGEVLRPDRVVIFPDRVEVVDFKTGAPRKRDQEQVRGYCTVLRQIYTQPVRGYLYYTTPRDVEEVV